MAITLEIKAVPKAGRQQLKVEKNGIIKCYLKNAAEHGKANKELIKYLSSLLKISQAEVAIIKGELTKNKVIIVHSIDNKAELYKKLQLEMQSSLA